MKYEFSCASCNKIQTVIRSKYQSKPRFCSKECRRSKDTFKAHCQHCNIYFERKKKGYKKPPVFCSLKCSDEHKKKNAKNIYEFNCQNCGKFVRAQRTKKVIKEQGLPKFCSYGCKQGGTPGFSWKTATEEEKKTYLERLYHSRVVIRDENQCYGWRGFSGPDGYARFFSNKKSKMAHVFSWEMNFGPVPDGMCVCHHCDVRHCSNPLHLFIGTHKENSEDMVSKGRSAKGSKVGNAKLSENQVEEIKKLLSNGVVCNYIAKQYNVNFSTIARIRDSKTWKHVLWPSS